MTIKLLLASVLLFSMSNAIVVANAGRAPASVRGVVTHRVSGCDYFVVETGNGYDLLEWFGGYDPDKGDVLVGEYESYGFHTVYVEQRERTLRAWTEDYDLSKSDALEQLADNCE